MLEVKNTNLDPPKKETIPCHCLIEVQLRRIKRRMQILKKTRENKPTSSGCTDDTFTRDVLFADIRFTLKTVESNY